MLKRKGVINVKKIVVIFLVCEMVFSSTIAFAADNNPPSQTSVLAVPIKSTGSIMPMVNDNLHGGLMPVQDVTIPVIPII